MKQLSLLGDESPSDYIPVPVIPQCDPWPLWLMLKKEKEVLGLYVTAHPLDEYREKLKDIDATPLSALENISQMSGQALTLAAVIDSCQEKITKKGQPYLLMKIQDRTNSFELFLFGADRLRYRMFSICEALCVIINGVVKPRNDGTTFDFKVDNVKLIS